MIVKLGEALWTDLIEVTRPDIDDDDRVDADECTAATRIASLEQSLKASVLETTQLMVRLKNTQEHVEEERRRRFRAEERCRAMERRLTSVALVTSDDTFAIFDAAATEMQRLRDGLRNNRQRFLHGKEQNV